MSLGTAGAQGGPSAPDDEELYPQNVCPWWVFLGQNITRRFHEELGWRYMSSGGLCCLSCSTRVRIVLLCFVSKKC